MHLQQLPTVFREYRVLRVSSFASIQSREYPTLRVSNFANIQFLEYPILQVLKFAVIVIRIYLYEVSCENANLYVSQPNVLSETFKKNC